MAHQRWTKEEILWLEKNYLKYGLAKAVKELKRSEQSILLKVHRMGLIRQPNKKDSKIHVYERKISITESKAKHYSQKREMEILFHRPLQTHEIINHNTLPDYDMNKNRKLQKFIEELRDLADVPIDNSQEEE